MKIYDKNLINNYGPPQKVLLEIMASCHSLTRVENDLTGDPLEIEIFK